MRVTLNLAMLSLLLTVSAGAKTVLPDSKTVDKQRVTMKVDAVKASNRTALLVGIDTSPSTGPVLAEMKAVGQHLLDAAPDGTQVGIIGFDSQSLKQLFSERAGASRFLESLSAGGKYSDLGRGVDGCLALLEESSATKAVVVFLTDGRVELPRKFRDKSDFAQILGREFAVRPYVNVFIIKVGGGKLSGLETLPQNVNVILLSNWQGAAAEIEKRLAPQIREQLSIVQTTTSASPVQPAVRKNVAGLSSTQSIFAGVALVFLVIVLAAVFRRKKGSAALALPAREDALRAEDLEPERSLEPVQEPVMIIEVTNTITSSLGALPERHVLRPDEKVFLGGSAFASGLSLAGLRQSRTVELTFDGAALECVRLRPDVPGAIDSVSLNRRDAPLSFRVGLDDELRIGDFTLRVLLADEESLALTDVYKRTTRPISLAAGSNRRLRRGSLRTQN